MCWSVINDDSAPVTTPRQTPSTRAPRRKILSALQGWHGNASSGSLPAISPYVDVEVIVSNTARNTVLDQDANIPVQRIGTWMNVASAPVCPGMVKAIRRTPADIVHLHIPNPTSIVSFFASRHPRARSRDLSERRHSPACSQVSPTSLGSGVCSHARRRSCAFRRTTSTVRRCSTLIARSVM